MHKYLVTRYAAAVLADRAAEADRRRPREGGSATRPRGAVRVELDRLPAGN